MLDEPPLQRDDQEEAFVVGSSQQQQQQQQQYLESSCDGTPTLSTGLRILYGLNGATLALPTTALLYIVNTRVSMPLEYLSAYGAIAFLPFSLKPMFAYVSEQFPRRDCLLVSLLVLSSLSIAATALIPEGGIVWCFLLAFLRGLTSAWPEFLLGITLVDEAQQQRQPSATTNSTSRNFSGSLWETTAARFQSQAATSRNIGSLLAFVSVLLLFVLRHQQLNDVVVNSMMFATGSLNIFGAVVGWIYRVGAPALYTRADTEDEMETSSCDVDNSTSLESQIEAPIEDSTSNDGSSYVNAFLLTTLQLTILIFALQDFLINATSLVCWRISLGFLLLCLLVCAGLTFHRGWTLPHCVGIFLIVKHSMPTTTYLMTSFLYDVFQSTPILLQLHSLFAMTATTMASWLYGRLLAPFGGNRFWWVVAGTTAAYAAASLLNLLAVGLADDHHVGKIPLFFLLGGLWFGTTFFSEWFFLPSTVLATTSVVSPTGPGSTTKEEAAATRMRYGALVSCIDFGSQIGAWLTVPLIASLRINRDNGYSNIDSFIGLCAAMSFAPLLLIPLLRQHEQLMGRR